MAGMNMLQMIKIMSTFDGRNYVEWTRSFNDILQITWPFLSKIVCGLERPEPILRENRRREGEENASDIDDSDSNSSDVSAGGSRNSDEEPSSSDGIEAWDTANNEHLFSVLRPTTTGVAQSVLLKFEPKNGQPGNGREAWLALKNKYQNTSRQRKRTLLGRLDNRVMMFDIDPDVFLSEVFQLRDELDDLGETVTDERLTTSIVLDALPKEMCPTVKMQSVRDPDLGLEEIIIGMVKTILVNTSNSERSPIPKKSKESDRKVRSSGREPRAVNVRESAMTLTCHSCKKPEHQKKNCKELMGKSDKPSNVDNRTIK